MYKTSDFDFDLPSEFIAQDPADKRDHSRLMVFESDGAGSGSVGHKHFYDLKESLGAGDVLVLNRSRVVPARILFQWKDRECELFMLKDLGNDQYRVLVRPGKYFPVGAKFELEDFGFEVREVLEDGSRIVAMDRAFGDIGETPLPPYITESTVDPERYQTVYSKEKGSVAAPTAGLHFTDEMLVELAEKGVQIEEIVLHVGRGTFLPVKGDSLEGHQMHSEEFVLEDDTAQRLTVAKSEGRRIIAVGTTSVRVLESCFRDGAFVASAGETDIFIFPGKYKWQAVDALITNFHLPKSTLIMLVASFLENKAVDEPVAKILELYEIAKKENYRFYSFGDAMFLV
ncbi:tRNA preQ1(34) S-adenosylmethionine ribosyltransferase-isomerase QueA [Candidatus Gracilibacteria bacterium]|nr:tRNA preQ1(34) S-adenosylmethionine ribosyltransferase-isomerase QueA [Candidatus Gracilibacteria bacterium]